jgi:hypothetical protein
MQERECLYHLYSIWIYCVYDVNQYVILGNLSIYQSSYGSTALLELGHFFSLLIYTHSVGLLGRGISPSQGRYLHTGQHKHRINAHIDIHALSGIRTHDPSVRASEDRAAIVIGGDSTYSSKFFMPIRFPDRLYWNNILNCV